jgi:hypothetical protein
VTAGQGELLEILAYIGTLETLTACITAPPRPNTGLMKLGPVRQSLNLTPQTRKFTKMRLAEYELIHAGLPTTHTRSSEEACPVWMQKGFLLYRNLEACGFQPYPGENERQWLETNSEASYMALLAKAPFHADSLEGRLQRQLILNENELPVYDPMNFFEEVTRYRLLHGILPAEKILSGLQLSAMLAAYTAWLSANKPDQLVKFGNPEEGVIYLASRPPQKTTPEKEAQSSHNIGPSLPLMDKE